MDVITVEHPVAQSTAKNRVLFVDRAAELSIEDKKALEGLGYLVIQVVGSPHQVVNITSSWA